MSIEVNGMSNIITLIDDYERGTAGDDPTINALLWALKQNARCTIEYMKAFDNAVSQSVRPPAWHEIKAHMQLEELKP